MLLPGFKSNTMQLVPLVTEGHGEALNWRDAATARAYCELGIRVKAIDEKTACIVRQKLNIIVLIRQIFWAGTRRL